MVELESPVHVHCDKETPVHVYVRKNGTKKTKSAARSRDRNSFKLQSILGIRLSPTGAGIRPFSS